MTEPSAPAEKRTTSTRTAFPPILCLTGFMGSGKTTVGAELARRLGYEFFDLDRVIEARAERSVEQIFAHEDESAFRAAEYDALLGLIAAAASHRVVALGGGAFLQPAIANLLSERQIPTFFLDASPEELYQRCVDSLDAAPRPLLKDLPSFRKLYAARLPFYEKADRRVETGARAVTEVVAAIQYLLRQEAEQAPQRMRR